MNQKTFQIDENLKAYTHLNFKNDPDEFQFAIITDNAGGARPGVFPKAVEMVNLLQPEFVVNAGDLIEGYSEDGKLVIYVQHDEPTDPKQRQNWLPAPKDGFRFTARFYGAATPLIDASYNMPGVVWVE